MFKIFCFSLLFGSILFTACIKELSLREPGALVLKTVDQDASLPSILVAGTQFHAETFGNPNDPIIIVLHGGPGSDYRYLLNCKAFSDEGYFVVFYDQRGSGLSKRHDKNTYKINIMENDLDDVVNYYRKSSDQKVFLLGHSWGAMLATAYINAHLEKINGAILGEPGGLVWQDVRDYVGRAQDFSITSETLNNTTYLDQFITGRGDDHDVLDYKFTLWAAADVAEDSPVGNEGLLPFWRNGAVVNRTMFELADKDGFDWVSNLKNFKTKILFVYSANNKAYGMAHAQKVSSAYPNVQLLKIDDAGHDMLSFPRGWQNFYPTGLQYFNALK